MQQTPLSVFAWDITTNKSKKQINKLQQPETTQVNRKDGVPF